MLVGNHVAGRVDTDLKVETNPTTTIWQLGMGDTVEECFMFDQLTTIGVTISCSLVAHHFIGYPLVANWLQIIRPQLVIVKVQS